MAKKKWGPEVVKALATLDSAKAIAVGDVKAARTALDSALIKLVFGLMGARA